MKSSNRVWLIALVLICLVNSTIPAQQNSSVARLKEQIKQLETDVSAKGSSDSPNTSNLNSLTEKRAQLRASLQQQLDSIREYQVNYGYRFSNGERAAVNELIRSWETDLRSLIEVPGSAAARISQPVEYSHALKPSPTMVEVATAADDDEEPTPSPTPAFTPTPDPELEAAKKEKALDEARKAASDAKKAAADAETAAIASRLAAARAKLGLGPTDAAPSATAPAGTTTAGTTPEFIETRILSETGARMASAELLRQMCGIEGAEPVKPPTDPVQSLKDDPMKILVINSSIDKAAISKYRTTVAQLAFLHDHYEKLIEQSKEARKEVQPNFAVAPLLVPAATQVVKNVADLLNLFRTDTVISVQTITIDNRMIVTNIANKLLATTTPQCQVKAIYEPGVYALTVPTTVKTGSLFDAYKKLLDDVTAGDAEINANVKKVAALNKQKSDLEAEITKLEAQIAEQKEKDKKEPNHKRVSRKQQKPVPPQKPFDIAAAEKIIKENHSDIDTLLVPHIARLNQTAANLTAFKTSLAGLFQILTAVDDTTKQPLLNTLITAERLSDILARTGTYVLDLSVKASGTNRTRRNMFFNTKVDHSGGVSIDANLFNNQDQLVFGRLEDFYIEFTGSKKIRERRGFKRLDELR